MVGELPQDGVFMRQTLMKICLGVLAVFSMVMCVPSISHAAAASQEKIEQTQEKIDQTQEDMNDLEAIISAHEKDLESLKGEQNELQKKLNELNAELGFISTELYDLETQIKQKEADIAVTQANLEAAKADEKWQTECMEKRIQYTYERGSDNFFANLLLAGSFGKILNLTTYVENILDYDDKMLEEMIGIREYIEAEEARLEKEKVDLSILKINAEADKSRVSELISELSSTVSEYEGQIEEAEKAALEYEAAMKKLEDNLEYLKKKLAEELAISAAAAAGEWRDISEITWTADDRYLLANLIYCEAGGEPYEGQVAVGAVVVNRMLSAKFPDTLVGVVYQKRQFAPVASGRLALALRENKATAKCYQAADEAMAGKTNVGNCLFFRTPIPGLVGIPIGGHIFY